MLVDFRAAFPSLNHKYMHAVLRALGIPYHILHSIQMLYDNHCCRLKVGGSLHDGFNISAGIRQGCPLSMLLFIISQEPLYSALENSTVIRPFRTPNCDIKLQGYADDTNLILADDQSITEAFNLVKQFEKATGASLNVNKTKVFGIGQWNGRTSWPISNVNIQTDCMSVLGIKFANNFIEATNICWTEVCTRITNKIRSMHSRRLTLFQRSVLVNALLTSQIWYYAQTYPMSPQWAKSINSLLFNLFGLLKQNQFQGIH